MIIEDRKLEKFVQSVMEDNNLLSDKYYYDERGDIKNVISAVRDLKKNRKAHALRMEMIDEFDLCPVCGGAKLEPEVIEGYWSDTEGAVEIISHSCPKCGYFTE